MRFINFSSIIFLFYFIIAVSVLSNNAYSQPKFEIGSKFSSILLPSLEDKKPMSIENFCGEKVILHIFASW